MKQHVAEVAAACCRRLHSRRPRCRPRGGDYNRATCSSGLLCPCPHRAEALSDDARLTSAGLSVAYIGPKSRTERPMKIKIGTEVAHVTRDSDTNFKVKWSKLNLQGAGAYCGGLSHSLLYRLN